MNWDRIVYFLVEQFVEGICWFVRLVISRLNTDRKTDGGYRQRWDSGLNNVLQNWHSSMQKMRLRRRMPSSKLHFSTQKNNSEVKILFQNCILRCKHVILASNAYFEIAFPTQKWDYGVESLFHNCTFRRRHEILVSNAFFKIAFFDANMRFWRRMPSSNLQFSMQIICQICDHVANLRMAFCDKVFQNLSSHALRASHGGGSPWVEQTRHAVFLYIHAVYIFQAGL